jgi:RNA polymerase sigma factor (sigma-70 family)
MSLTGTDAVLVAESLTRPARFAVLYERHLQQVTRYLARRVGSDVAEDLTAEVFVRAFRARESFRPYHETALPWLLGIANHLVSDHRREERRRLAVLERLASATSVELADVELAELTPEIVRRLRRVPATERDTLLLLVWGELSYAEVAVALGVPVGTVRSRVSRARARMAKSITGRVEPTVDTPQQIVGKREANE